MGYVHLASSDQLTDDEWPRCVFLLTDSKLIYASPKDQTENIEEEIVNLKEEYEDMIAGDDTSLASSGALMSLDVMDVSAELPLNVHPPHSHLIKLTIQGINNDSEIMFINTPSAMERLEWMAAFQEAKNTASLKRTSRKSQTSAKFSLKLSNLVIYTQATKFKGFVSCKSHKYYQMTSINENKAVRLLKREAVDFVQHTAQRLVRVYPQGHRINSSNFDPQFFWNIGVQMVALNYQTPDEGTWDNHAFFLRNGGCGYIRKPDQLLLQPNNTADKDQDIFDLFDLDCYNTADEIKIKITPICFRYLFPQVKPKAGAPLCMSMAISGTPYDESDERRFTASKPGPIGAWTGNAAFSVLMPELALLK